MDAMTNDDTKKPGAPREWWLEKWSTGWMCHSIKPDNESFVHVIEHAAYLEKCEELAEAKHDIEVHNLFAEAFGDLSCCYDAHDVTCVIQRAFDEQKEELTAAKAEIERLKFQDSTTGMMNKAVHAELTTAKAEIERLEKLYLEMRDGHEHVVHKMNGENERIRNDLIEERTRRLRYGVALEDIRDNYDCDCDSDSDSDAHKYKTGCRCCTARAALEETE